MEDWIKEAADRLKARREEEKRRLGRTPNAGRTLHSDAPLLWRRLAHKMETAVNEFNREFVADPLCPSPLLYTRLDHSLTVSTVYCNHGHPTRKLVVTFYGDRAVLVCGLSSSDGSEAPDAGLPHELQFRVDNDGEVKLYHGDHIISLEHATKLILEPLIDSTELIAY
ncbi:MAG TPA: hypothetical protein VLZ81_15410 [Blastocatellia bacterium]|nr:hypothetical protein [Blastocatellia bacterium]